MTPCPTPPHTPTPTPTPRAKRYLHAIYKEGLCGAPRASPWGVGVAPLDASPKPALPGRHAAASTSTRAHLRLGKQVRHARGVGWPAAHAPRPRSAHSPSAPQRDACCLRCNMSSPEISPGPSLTSSNKPRRQVPLRCHELVSHPPAAGRPGMSLHRSPPISGTRRVNTITV